jgi:hypothetical protein
VTVVRNLSASLVEMRTVLEAGVEPDTVMKGVPPTSLPKSNTIAAGLFVDVVVRTAVPVVWPVRAPAFVTEPWVPNDCRAFDRRLQWETLQGCAPTIGASFCLVKRLDMSYQWCQENRQTFEF